MKRWIRPALPCTHRVRVRLGFTLIELLVVIAVIAVIAVLISVLLPALSGARKASKGVVCLSGLRSIGQAVVIYCSENKDKYPISSHTSGSITRSDAWLLSLEEYGVNAAFRRCPMDEHREQKLTSYANNEHFEPLTPGLDYSPITRLPLPGGRKRTYDRIGFVPRPSATIYVFEPTGEGTADHLNTHQFRTSEDVRIAVAVIRHQGSGHYLFADGHASAWPWSDLHAKFSPATSPFDPETATK